MTVPESPLHLWCRHCDVSFYSLHALTEHCFDRHPQALGINKCARDGCGHRRSAHVPNKRAYCQAADPRPCACPNYVEPVVSDVA